MDFPVTVESQEAFDALVKERLARETRKQAELEQQVETLRQENTTLTTAASKQQEAMEAAKQEAAVEAAAALRQQVEDRLRAAEVRALAANLRFNDPLDAVAALGDLSGFEVGEDFTVDATQIKTELGAIVERKPYLVAAAEDFSFEKDAGLGQKGGGDPLAGKTGTELMASAFDAQK